MRQFAWFDCLRCAAIFLVLLAHVGDLSRVVPGSWLRAANDLQLISWVGVDLFFVLSGFLVSGLLFAEHEKTGSLRIGRFLVRRAFKIIPPFYVLILCTVCYDAYFRGSVNFTHLLHDVFFIQNYRAGAWPQAWTLALEVHFYLLLALLLLYFYRRSASNWLSRLPAIIGWGLVAGFLARWINSGLRSGAFNAHREFQPSHLHLDVLAAGVLLRIIYNYRPDLLAPFRRMKAIWIGLGLLFVWPSEYLWGIHPALLTALIPTCNYLGFGLILFEATQIPYPLTGAARWLLAPLTYLGKHSYSIYLWHLAVKEWLIVRFIPDRGVLFFCSYFLACLAVGTFFSIVLEMPVLHFRNRFFPSSTAATAHAARLAS